MPPFYEATSYQGALRKLPIWGAFTLMMIKDKYTIDREDLDRVEVLLQIL